MLRDYGKLLGLLGALAAVTVLLITDNLDPVAGAGLIGTIVGYLTGNGQNAVTGSAPSPVLVPPPGKVAEADRRRAYEAGAADVLDELDELAAGDDQADALDPGGRPPSSRNLSDGRRPTTRSSTSSAGWWNR